MKASDTIMSKSQVANIMMLSERVGYKKGIDVAEEQAEITFKAVIEEVVEWVENNAEPIVPMSIDYRKWHAQKKKWGIV